MFIDILNQPDFSEYNTKSLYTGYICTLIQNTFYIGLCQMSKYNILMHYGNFAMKCI